MTSYGLYVRDDGENRPEGMTTYYVTEMEASDMTSDAAIVQRTAAYVTKVESYDMTSDKASVQGTTDESHKQYLVKARIEYGKDDIEEGLFLSHYEHHDGCRVKSWGQEDYVITAE